jgi:hypothetical protein
MAQAGTVAGRAGGIDYPGSQYGRSRQSVRRRCAAAAGLEGSVDLWGLPPAITPTRASVWHVSTRRLDSSSRRLGVSPYLVSQILTAASRDDCRATTNRSTDAGRPPASDHRRVKQHQHDADDD